MLVSQAERSAYNDARTGALTVSQAMQAAKQSLESITVRLIGEISEVNAKPGYKAVYFTVKDEGASLPCMMWLNRYHQSGVTFAVGMLVELTGRFTLYAPKGRMNFDVFSASLAGEGELRRRVADLARKLEREGLMDPAKKRPVPAYPERIGVVTSPRGAAVHDVLRTLRRRFPLAEVSVAGVPVEGAGAPANMIEGLVACVQARCDVILLVRGGGSFEDLMPFNDEGLARAISRCPIPVITGIGHEPDTSIADMVSDVRASTPTAAAEAVSPDGSRILQTLSAQASLMHAAVRRRLDAEGAVLARAESRPVFSDARTLFATDMLTVDMLHDRLSRALPSSLEKDALRLGRLAERMHASGSNLAQPFEHQLALRAGRLHDLSPLAVLSRGYAMAQDAQGHVVSKVSQVALGDSLVLSVSDGAISCEVSQVLQTALQSHANAS